MFARFFYRWWLTVAILFLTALPLWAQEENIPPETQEWVLSYVLIILFLGLTLLILLRPTKRSDSAFSFDEQQAKKEEEMKKIKGSH